MAVAENIIASKLMLNRMNLAINAQNLANMGTYGFEQTHMITRELPVGSSDQSISFAREDGMMRDTSQGGMTLTGNKLDLTVNTSRAYMARRTPEGEVVYTLNGTGMMNEQRQIADDLGNVLLDTNQEPLTIPIDVSDVKIAKDGTVSSYDGRTFGQVGLFTFENVHKVRSIQNNMLTTDQAPVPIENPSFTSGALRKSNVNPILATANLIELQKNDQMEQHLFELKSKGDDRMRSELLKSYS
ncbi:MAG: hypothetical protein ACPGXY_03755 [Alphaproteobacteria bacterium]